MKELPIIFKSGMRPPIIDGRKTMTRRLVKLKNPDGYETVTDDGIEIVPWTANRIEKYVRCPYGKKGDLLWVREPHWHERGTDFENIAFEDGTIVQDDGKRFKIPDWKPDNKDIWKKRSLLFMPKWAAGLWLENKGVGVEKLQDITDTDVIAEGIDLFDLSIKDNFFGKKPPKNLSFPYWIDGPEGQSAELYCQFCVEKEIARLGEGYEIDGGWAGGEEDGRRFCDKCGKVLEVCFSGYGMETEIEHFKDNPIACPDDVLSILTVLSDTNLWDDPYHKELAPLLRRICFRELWDSINGKGSWNDNPWVRAIKFEVKSVNGRTYGH